MENYKNTLYLGALCILLVIWGSIIDGKRHIVEKRLAIETARIAAAEQAAEEGQMAAAKCAEKIDNIKSKLVSTREELKAIRSQLEEKSIEAAKLADENSELSSVLEQNRMSMIRLAKVNALLKQRVAACTDNDDDIIFELKQLLQEKENRIKELEEAINSLRKNMSSSSGMPAADGTKCKCNKMADAVEKACSTRTRICNRSRTQLAAALKDCQSALEITEKNRNALAEEISECKNSSEVEMYKLNISILLSKIQEQNEKIASLEEMTGRLKARLAEKDMEIMDLKHGERG
jgi:predicted RNase H-like nuclease (RuvC/YqgF family)